MHLETIKMYILQERKISCYYPTMMLLLNIDSIITGVCRIKLCVKWCTCINFQNALKLCDLTTFFMSFCGLRNVFHFEKDTSIFIPIRNEKTADILSHGSDPYNVPIATIEPIWYNRCSSIMAVWVIRMCWSFAENIGTSPRFNTLWPRQKGRYFLDDILKCIFLNENVWISITISLKFVHKGPFNNIPALVQIMAWRRPGDKPLSEPMMVSLLAHIYVTRPQ